MRSSLGLYQPGSSWLHHLPAAPKLIGLIVVSMATVYVRRWEFGVAAVVLVVALGYLFAGLGLRCLARQLRPVWVVLVFTAAMHLLTRAWHNAWSIPLTIAALVAFMKDFEAKNN